MSLYEQILGSLLGQAFGDAFAMPAMLDPDTTWKRYGGWIRSFHPGPAGHPAHDGFAAARVTDDTEQAFALAASILQNGGVTVQGAASALIRWYDSVNGDEAPFVGPSTRKACQALKRGDDPRSTGLSGDTNGGAMRICPVGLIHPGDPGGAVRDTAVACRPSHYTDVAVSAAAAVAAAIAAALSPGMDLAGILTAARDGARRGRALGSPWFGPSIDRRIALAVEIVSGADPADPEDDREIFKRIRELYEIIGSTLAAADAVPSAFGVFHLAGGDPLLCARYAAALSGDADTVAAMACAVAGAWRGAQALPADLVAQLRAANPELDFDGVARGLTGLAELSVEKDRPGRPNGNPGS